MKKLSLKEYILYSAIIVGGILIDQITKILSTIYLEPVDTVPIIKGVLHLTYVMNKGAAFGMLADHRWVFMSLSTAAIIALGVYLFKFCKETLFTKIGFALIIGGGIGNMIDRITLKYVVDMIDCRFIDFYVFNFADSCVCVGAAMVCIGFILSIYRDYKSKKEGQAEPQPSVSDNDSTGE